MRVDWTLTTVVLPAALSASLAACCGVSGVSGACGASRLCALIAALAFGGTPAGTANLVTVFFALSQSQTVLPSRMMSVSLIVCGTARRKCLSSEASDVGLPTCGRRGSPRAVVSTTVPVSGGTLWVLAMPASSCAGVFGGRAGGACAMVTAEAAMTPPAMTTAAAGTAHRAFLDSLIACMPPLCRKRAVKTLRAAYEGRC